MTKLLLKDTEVAEILNCSTRHVARQVELNPDFPRPVKIGGSTRWRVADITAYIAGL